MRSSVKRSVLLITAVCIGMGWGCSTIQKATRNKADFQFNANEQRLLYHSMYRAVEKLNLSKFSDMKQFSLQVLSGLADPSHTKDAAIDEDLKKDLSSYLGRVYGPKGFNFDSTKPQAVLKIHVAIYGVEDRYSGLIPFWSSHTMIATTRLSATVTGQDGTTIGQSSEGVVARDETSIMYVFGPMYSESHDVDPIEKVELRTTEDVSAK